MMEGAHILGYEGSPNFLVEEDFPHAQELGYILRQAKDRCGLHGVYVLRAENTGSPIPIVYYCQANTEANAKRIHQLVWNQGIVPFVLVETRAYLRVYSGFRFSETDGILRAPVALHEVIDQLAAFHAGKIDDGTLWKEWGGYVTPETRVDWTLLHELKELDKFLQQASGVRREISHALIGKFVYFRYLRDRNIISDLKLAQWGIRYESVFSRNASLESFLSLDRQTDEWLNGSIFPCDPDALSSLSPSLFQRVAGVFVGDRDEQLHLDFQPYDFSFIPIETLSVIYQQFLHLPEPGQGTSRGRQLGAYYTPLPLISFMHEELERKRPLTKGIKILDPSCGSGSFLVQCYRRLIEKQHQQIRRPLKPTELRDILTEQIFGVEQDGDACRVAELSLVLTLLDYVNPMDLENNPNLLPTLRNTNIFEADFFNPDSIWAKGVAPKAFDWVIGNPPWYDLKSQDIPEEYRYVWKWVQAHSNEFPIGGNQVAEAFVWNTLTYLKQDGIAGLVLPAMTLFKKESHSFRKAFFAKVHVWCVANFANLAEVLFAGRSRRPALALFFQQRNKSFESDPDDVILTYSPLIINQEANRPNKPGKRNTTWRITINSGEIQEVSTNKAATGEMLPWKLAMWGCFRDEKLLKKVARFPRFIDFCESHGLDAHQGLELREKTAQSREPLEPRPELEGRKRVNFKKLRRRGRLFVFPDYAIDPIPRTMIYVRKGRVEVPMRVSTPPHILVDAGRRFAIYSDEFIAVPARQIGVASSDENIFLLKALSLYLSSDFVTYQQFFTAQEWGISTSRATLDSLNHLPVPLDKLSPHELHEWAKLRDALAAVSQSISEPALEARSAIQAERVLEYGVAELNAKVFDVLGLRESERCLVQDFVATNMQCIQGKVTKQIINSPSTTTMKSYTKCLKQELDAFIAEQSDMRHEIIIHHDTRSAMIAIRLTQPKLSTSFPLLFGMELKSLVPEWWNW